MCAYSHDITTTENPYNNDICKQIQCSYFAQGNCRYGDRCRFSHSDYPPVASTTKYSGKPSSHDVSASLIPSQAGHACFTGAAAGTTASQQQEATSADANLQVQEVETEAEERICAICFELPTKFGLLTGCDHIFCYECLMEWRKAQFHTRNNNNNNNSDDDSDDDDDDSTRSNTEEETKTQRACPTCRNHSDYVIPSKVYAKSSQGKEEIIAEYKRRLSCIPCKHFMKNGQKLGSCPFGRDCFYQHFDKNGKDIKQFDKSVSELHAEFLERKRRRRRHRAYREEVELLESFLLMLQLHGSRNGGGGTGRSGIRISSGSGGRRPRPGTIGISNGNEVLYLWDDSDDDDDENDYEESDDEEDEYELVD